MQVIEIFRSLQGEGRDAGLPALFIRLAGCNVHCPFCDTKESWNINSGFALNKEELDVYINKNQLWKGYTPLVIITGGEPFLQQDALIQIYEQLERRCADFRIETSASVPLTQNFINFVSVHPHAFKLNISPKYFAKELRDEYADLMEVNEVRFAVEPYGGEQTLEWVDEVRNEHKIFVEDTTLSPVINGDIHTAGNEFWIQKVAQTCMERGFRFSLQQHKLWGIK